MNEHPISLSGDEVLLVLDGRKTQVRKIVKWLQWTSLDDREKFAAEYPKNTNVGFFKDGRIHKVFQCPFGYFGDRLWVRESFQVKDLFVRNLPPGDLGYCEHFKAEIMYRADKVVTTKYVHMENWRCYLECESRWHSSAQMPRWASRIDLKVENIRIERLQSISNEDAKACGYDGDFPTRYIPSCQKEPYAYHFCYDWCQKYGEDSWDLNPWAWVIDFDVVKIG